MSVQLLLQPEGIALSRNPMLFRFQAEDDSGRPFGGVGVWASVRTNAGGFQLGDRLELIITEPDTTVSTIVFTAVAAPSTAEEIQAEGYTPGGLEYFELVASQLQAHPAVAPFFVASARADGSNFVITLTAKLIEPGWLVVFDVSGVSPGSAPLTEYIDTVTPDNTPDNYKLLLDVFFESGYLSGNFERVAQLEGIPDAESQISFSISDILDHELRVSLAELPIPRFNSSDLVKVDNLRRYYIRFREEYDNGANGVTSWTTLPVNKILCGGLSQNFFTDYDFFDELGKENSLLSWYPDGKTVSPDQPEYLAWINHTGATIKIAVSLTRYSESGVIGSSNFYIGNSIELDPYETILIPIGYEQLQLNNPDILKYTVQVADQSKLGNVDQGVSAGRTFFVDHRHHEELRYIQYLNSFCVPQTLRCTGEQTHELKIKREESRSIENQFSTKGQTFQHDFDFRDVFTYRSGYLSRYEVKALSEILIYNQAFEVYEEGYIALNIKSKNFKLTDGLQNLHAIEFKAEPRLNLQDYSNISIPLSDDQQTEGWRVFPDQFWRTSFGSSWKTI